MCQDTCEYKGVRYNVLDLIEDKEACRRMRCSLPPAAFAAVGLDGLNVKSLSEEEILQAKSTLEQLSYR